MLKPYTRHYLPVKHLLNPVDDTGNASQSELNANLPEMVYEESDKRFIENRQKKQDGIVAKVDVKIFNGSDLLENATMLVTLCSYCCEPK